MSGIRVRYMFEQDGGWRWKPPADAVQAGFSGCTLGKNLAKAVAKAEKLNEKLDAWRRGEAAPVVHATSMTDLFSAYMESSDWPEHPVTRDQYTRHIYALKGAVTRGQPLGVRRPSTVTAPIIDSLYRAMKDDHGERTAQYRMAVLKACWNTCLRLQLVEHDPFKGLRMTTPAPRSETWEPEEIEAFCAKACELDRPEIALLVKLQYDIGLRPGDLRDLTWDEWTGVAFMLETKKRNMHQCLEVAPELADELNRMQRTFKHIICRPDDGTPYPQPTFNVWFNRIRDAAGIPDHKQCRDIRRTVATELFEVGAEAGGVKDVLGHTDIRTSNNYNATAVRGKNAGRALRMRREARA